MERTLRMQRLRPSVGGQAGAVLVVGLAVAFAVALAGFFATPAAGAGGRIQYAALGDSIAVGYGATNHYGYVDRFRDFLATKYRTVDLTNGAIPGLNSSGLLLQLTFDETTRNAVRRAEVVTVSIGGNNLLPCASDNYTTLNTTCGQIGVYVFQQDWPRILFQIRRSIGSRARLFAMTVYDPYRGDDPNYATAEGFIQAVNGSIRDGGLTATYGYQVADAYGAFQGKLPDGTWKVCTYTHFCEATRDPHPTDAGHAEIARLHELLYG